MSNEHDLQEDELAGFARRLELAFKRRQVLPTQSIQYRIGETGQRRIHPYALKRILDSIASARAGEDQRADFPIAREVASSVYTAPTVDPEDAKELLEDRASDFRHLGTADWETGYAGLVAAISDNVGGLDPLPYDISPVQARLAGAWVLPAYSRAWQAQHTGKVCLWITQEPGWLCADDPRLWKIVHECCTTGARLLIISRYIDPSAFVLFKALGIRGLQYYHMWVAQREQARIATASERLGWFGIKGQEQAPKHRAMQQISGALAYLTSTTWEPATQRAVDEAESAGLVGAAPDAVLTTNLVRWAEKTSLALPDKWVETVRRLSVWRGQVPLQVRTNSSSVRPKRSRTKQPKPESQKRETPPETLNAGTAASERRTTISRVPVRGW
jgi:hypothetical protein